MKTFLITTATLGLATAALAQGGSQISMDEVPEVAMAAAQENAPAGVSEFESVQLDPDADTETYEFAATKDDGMAIEVDVLADGTLEEVEEEVGMEAVPQQVAATLDQEVPGLQPAFIEKSTRPGGIVYEFEGQLEGQEVDIEINEDGSGFVNNADTAG